MERRTYLTALRQKWSQLAHTLNTILPKSSSFRFLAILAMAIGAINLFSPMIARQPDQLTEPSLSPAELEVARTYASREHVSLEAAKAAIVAARPTEEENRRFKYEREQREKAAEDIQVGLCQSQPWLDRCR